MAPPSVVAEIGPKTFLVTAASRTNTVMLTAYAFEAVEDAEGF
jgi:hypothetical protein